MLADLMDQFVLVRLVRAENLDLSLFRFDPDLAFAVFFLHADGTLYGRFGSRSDFFEAERDISLEALRQAMLGALDLHRRVDQLREVLAAKRGPEPRFKRLSDYPTKSSGYSRVIAGSGGSCTHCHDLRTTEQMAARTLDQFIPDRLLFAWPMPDAIGLRLDPQEKATVRQVTAGSSAERSGFRTGDMILRLQQQPLLSIADVQWVLQNAGDEDVLDADVIRNGERLKLSLQLDQGWRRAVDISWRTTTRHLRRRFLDGIEYQVLAAEERKSYGLPPDRLALRAARGVSRNSDKPIRREDVIIAIDGRTDAMNEAELIAYLVQQKKPGDLVSVTLLRDGERLQQTLYAK